MNRLVLKAAACLLAAFSPAAMARAEPVTYSGMLGRSEIVVEFTDDPAEATAAVAGRYFYRSKGVDIPLQASTRANGRITLNEEAACDQAACLDGADPPVAAVWRLASTGAGGALRGTWEGGKSLPIALKRVSSRPEPEDASAGPLGLFQFTDQMTWNVDDGPITAQVSPYDHLRFQAAMTEGELEGQAPAQFRYLVDPRTRFRFPRLVGGPAESANRLLQGRHERMSLSALDCVALQYAGFHEPDIARGTEGGTLGGYDETTIEVTYLSPRLMSWTEAGSIFCGGAHPENFSTSYSMDVVKGRLLAPSDIFKGWTDEQPSQAVADLVRERRPKPTTDEDKAFETECGIDDLISTNLAVRFRREGTGDFVVFALEDLPHAINACGEDLLELPVSEVRPLMRPEAAPLLFASS